MGEVSLHSQCAILGELVLGTLDRIREELTTDGYLGSYVEASLDTGRRQVVEYLINMYYKQKVSGVLIVKEEPVEQETTPKQAYKRRRANPSSSLSRYKNGETVNKKQKLKVQVDNCGDIAEEFGDDEIEKMSLNVGSDLDSISLGIHHDTDDVPDIASSTTTPAKNTKQTTNRTTVSKSNVRTQDPPKTTPVVVVQDIFDQNVIWVDPSSLTTDKPVDFGAREDETKPLECGFSPLGRSPNTGPSTSQTTVTEPLQSNIVEDVHSDEINDICDESNVMKRYSLRISVAQKKLHQRREEKKLEAKATKREKDKIYQQRKRDSLKFGTPTKYEAFKKKDAQRSRVYRLQLTPTIRRKANEKAKIRMQKYRERQKEKKTPVITRNEREKLRKKWREQKQKRSQSMTEQQKENERMKRRLYYRSKTKKNLMQAFEETENNVKQDI